MTRKEIVKVLKKQIEAYNVLIEIKKEKKEDYSNETYAQWNLELAINLIEAK